MGEAPIPDDVRHIRQATPEDIENFQTIFASKEGAVTAPVTGLHFSRELMKRMEIAGINQAFITLHVGLGNFRQIDVEDLTKHKCDSEQMFVEEEACRLVNESKANGKRVCAIGATVLRATETAAGPEGILKEFEGWTSRFIFPPYDFTVCDSFVSNFQLPLSTMLMLACAFGGYENVMKAYKEALTGEHDYKFGTYGDALLIL